MPAEAKGIEIYYDGEYHTYTGTLYDLYVNGKKLDVPLEPITFNNRALVPIREVFEALGAEVDFVSETREIMISGNNTEVTLQIGNNTAYVNGKKVSIPDGVVPKLITKVGVETKTMVPVRFVSEELGMKVDFDGDKGAIRITTGTTGETESKIKIKTPVITKKDSLTTVIKITTDRAMASAVKASVTSAGVLYFDIQNAEYEGASKTQVDHAAVTAVRMGLHDGYTRVAVDMKDYKSYNVVTANDKKSITVTVVAKSETTGEETPTVPSTPDNTPSDSNTNTDYSAVTVDVAALKKYTASNGIKYVVIDAGHGGKDSGAVGSLNGVSSYEKDITLAVAKLVQKELQASGVNVIMTRTGDTYPTLSERSTLANENDAAMFVSIHVNSASNAPKANGIEVYYAGKNNNNYYGITSKALATEVLNDLLAETGALNRGVKTENHLVTRTSVMPAILVEIGFISNDAEIQNLNDAAYQQKLANGISKGILAQLGKITVPDRRELTEKLVADQIGAEKAAEYMNEMWK